MEHRLFLILSETIVEGTFYKMFAVESKMLFSSHMFVGLMLMAIFFNFLVIRTCAEGEVRLINGEDRFEGLVEIFKDGQWGTICDDGWDIADAHVVCRQLGLGYAASAYREESFGRGSGPIVMDEVSCVGDEERLDQCSFRGWFLHDCVHQEDVGIRCSTEDGGLRLVDGNTLFEGRIEVYQNGEWGTVCDDSWDDKDATVVCRALGFGYPAQAFSNAHFGEGSGKIVLSNIDCDGTERRLEECSQKEGFVLNCEHSEDAGVKCSEPDIPNDICNSYEVRIADGPTESDGIVEVCYKGHWGTVCANSWKEEEAIVVCRQLGYTVLDTIYSRLSTESVPNQIVENLLCNQYDLSLSNCDVTFGNPNDCTFNAGLSCSGEVECIEGRVRLDEGNSRSSGRVQVCKTGQWVILCGTSWGNDEARVVCRQLGYSTVRSYDSVSINTLGVDVSGIQSVSCRGTEVSLSYCSLVSRPSCSQQATVTCSADSGDGGGRGVLAEALSGGFGTIVGIAILFCICWCVYKAESD